MSSDQCPSIARRLAVIESSLHQRIAIASTRTASYIGFHTFWDCLFLLLLSRW